MRGRIVRGVGGLFYVCGMDAPEEYACSAKGIFRKEKIRLLPGDLVEFDALTENREGNITNVLPRRNSLARPAVANVDQAVAVFSMASPAPSPGFIDRLLVQMESLRIPSILCFNKTDLAPAGEMERLRAIYGNSGYPLLFVSGALGDGVGALYALLKGKTSVLAGPSGVGKSTLFNRLQSQVHMETGSVSGRIERGRHTTRHTQLTRLDDGASFLLDTPGFSALSVEGISREKLGDCFPEIASRKEGCRFAGCSHISDPDCAVRRAVEEGAMSPERYGSYCALYAQAPWEAALRVRLRREGKDT